MTGLRHHYEFRAFDARGELLHHGWRCVEICAARQQQGRQGDLLKRLEADRRTLRELTDDEWAAEGVPEGAALLDPDRSIASRPGPGGPSPASVLAQCDALTAAAGP